MKKIVRLSLFFLCLSCGPKESENCHKRISYVNNTDKRFYLLRANDTILDQSSPNPLNQISSEILPLSFNNEALLNRTSGSVSCYEGSFNYYSQLVVFVFDAELIESENWDYIKENYLVSKRYILTINDLQARNWTLYHEE